MGVDQQPGIRVGVLPILREELEEVFASHKGEVGYRHAKIEVYGVAREGGTGGIRPDADHGIRRSGFQDFDLWPHTAGEPLSAAVGCLTDKLSAVLP